jgi:hypothetical protein
VELSQVSIAFKMWAFLPQGERFEGRPKRAALEHDF